jgi:hypothetical protein
MSSKVTCSSCGHSWNKSDSSKKDATICHICGKDNIMKGGGKASKYIQKIPETFDKGVATSDATAVKPIIKQKKQVGNYKKVDSTIADTIKNVVLPGWLPDNAKQLASKLIGDSRMSNNSLNDEQKVLLWDVMQNAKKRTGKADGGTEYEDYGGLGYGSSEDFNKWWNRGGVNANNILNSFTNPAYELSSTIGRGRYWTDPEDSNKMYYTDVYDWNPGEKSFAGSNLYQIARNALRNNEDKNLNKEKNENYRMNFELNAEDIEKIREKRNRPSEYYLDRNGGWLDKYNDGGPIQPNYNDASTSFPPNFVGQGYDTTGRNYSPAWGGQFEDGGELPNKPKGWLDKIDDVMSAPARGATWLATKALTGKGKYVDPSEAMHIKNPYAKMAVDMALDPTNLLGIGLAGKLSKIAKGSKILRPMDSVLGTLADGSKIIGRLDNAKRAHNVAEKAKKIDDLFDVRNIILDHKIFNAVELGAKDIKGATSLINDLIKQHPEQAAQIQKVAVSKIPGYKPTTLPVQKNNKTKAKPTQPVIYQKPEPTPQSTIDWMEGNGYAQEFAPEITTEQTQQSGTPNYGEVVDPRTGYTHMTRQGSPMYPLVGQPQMAMGGSMPGAVGFTYARTGGIPSNGKYAKKTKASAQNGMEMSYYQNGLDFRPKSISRNGSVIKDDMGQWNHPGEITEIGSNQITMQGVPYPVLGISDTGHTQMMYPNQEYQYNGKSVTEYPMAQNGGSFFDTIKAVGQFMLNQPDSNAENIAEIFDPFGVSSWDDVYRSINNPKDNLFDTGLEIAGAVPLGKLSKITKPGIHLTKYKGIDKALYKNLPRTKAANNTVKGIQTVGRTSDAYQAYDQYEQGGQLTKLDQLTNFTNYNTKQPGGWLDKYNN